jgi:hypothetical protein
MRSLRRPDLDPLPRFLGVDLTDRYGRHPRPIDVCGLNDDLQAHWWTWEWPATRSAVDITHIADEIRHAQEVMIDGVQALARIGEFRRECEATCSTAGRTGDQRPRIGKPYAGFICSSLDIFEALRHYDAHHVNETPTISEVYPAFLWASFGTRLPKKSLISGRVVRRKILESFQVKGLPAIPTHDQNDACIAALLGAAAAGLVPGMKTTAVGLPLEKGTDGIWREGQLIIPLLQKPTVTALGHSITAWLTAGLGGYQKQKAGKRRIPAPG